MLGNGGDSIAAGWVEESFAYEKPEIPKCTAINSTVGAGDAFLGGLLVGLESLVSKKCRCSHQTLHSGPY